MDPVENPPADEPAKKGPPATLVAYSEGKLSWRQACRELRLHDNSALLPLLGDYGLPRPMPSEEEIEAQADVLVGLMKP